VNGLGLADLVVIAGRTLGLNTAQVLDLLDLDSAERALALVRHADAPADPAGLAATLLRALVIQRPLRRGNEQVALAAMLQFLALNGWDLEPDPPGPVAELVVGLAAGTREVWQVADCLAPRLRPRDPAGALVSETQMRQGSARLLAERIRRASMRGQLERIRRGTMRRQPTDRFRRFTDRARRVVVLAQQEARLLQHGYIGTEHLLLGLLREGGGVAAETLESLGISREAARGQVEEIIGRGPEPSPGHIPFTPRAKKVLELSLREALALGHHYIGTEHLLLGLLCEGKGVAAQVLVRLGADHASVRDRALDLLAGRIGRPDPPARVARRWTADIDDVQALVEENQLQNRELDRLRRLLREHGIDPDGGAARSA
jgi:prophage maintenance system killer protein